MTHLHASAVLPLATLVLGACVEAPINDNPVGVPPALNSISGEVVFGGDDEAPIGPTFITLYDAENPGPPVGTGGPVTFSSVPAEAFPPPDAGLRAASFGVSNLADGGYLVNALMDVDGDFNPFVSVLAGATCGDWVGTHLDNLDLNNPQSAVVPLSGGEYCEGVTVLVGQQIPTERPAFQFLVTDPEAGANPVVSLATASNPLTPQRFRVGAATIATGFSPDTPVALGPACPTWDIDPTCTEGAFCLCDPDTFQNPKSELYNPCATAFYVLLEDADLDGVPDPYPAPAQAAAGIPNIWPRVFVEYAGGDLGTFTFNGEAIPERWVTQAYPLLAELGLAAAYGQGPETVVPAIGAPFPTSELSITFAPVFLHYHEGGAAGVDPNNGPFDVVDLTQGGSADAVPPGIWSVTLMSFTGQTWQVPNEIGALNLPGDPPFDATTQAGAVIITP